MFKINKLEIPALVKNYYLWVKDKENIGVKKEIKLHLREKNTNKNKIILVSYSIKDKMVVLNEEEILIKLDFFSKEKKEIKEVLNEEVDNIIIKQIDEEELLSQCSLCLRNNLDDYKGFKFDLIKYYKSGLKGKYIIETIIEKDGLTITKDFFCSISKKDFVNKKIFINITHLEKKELLGNFKKIEENTLTTK